MRKMWLGAVKKHIQVSCRVSATKPGFHTKVVRSMAIEDYRCLAGAFLGYPCWEAGDDVMKRC